jgi:hypothetical protein
MRGGELENTPVSVLVNMPSTKAGSGVCCHESTKGTAKVVGGDSKE